LPDYRHEATRLIAAALGFSPGKNSANNWQYSLFPEKFRINFNFSDEIQKKNGIFRWKF